MNGARNGTAAFRGALALFALSATACRSTDARSATGSQAASRSEGQVVARVNGEAITLKEVEELVQATDMSPTLALKRLEEERLLSAYAAGRGYGNLPHHDRTLRQARVRALLANMVEAGTGPGDIQASAVEERFEAVRGPLERPASRSLTHVLFKSESAATESKASTAAAGLLRELLALGATDQQVATLEAIPLKGERAGVPVVRESFDAMQNGKLEAPFEQAVFGLDKPGPVIHPVRTRYGFHVIVVKALNPAVTVRLADYESQLRDQLSLEKRKESLAELLEKLKAKDSVQLDEASVNKALSDARLVGTLP